MAAVKGCAIVVTAIKHMDWQVQDLAVDNDYSVVKMDARPQGQDMSLVVTPEAFDKVLQAYLHFQP